MDFLGGTPYEGSSVLFAHVDDAFHDPLPGDASRLRDRAWPSPGTFRAFEQQRRHYHQQRPSPWHRNWMQHGFQYDTNESIHPHTFFGDPRFVECNEQDFSPFVPLRGFEHCKQEERHRRPSAATPYGQPISGQHDAYWDAFYASRIHHPFGQPDQANDRQEAPDNETEAMPEYMVEEPQDDVCNEPTQLPHRGRPAQRNRTRSENPSGPFDWALVTTGGVSGSDKRPPTMPRRWSLSSSASSKRSSHSAPPSPS